MSAADELEFFFQHRVTVDTHTGEGAYGATYAPTSQPLRCFLDDSRQLVRSSTGDQVVSETTLTGPVEDFDKYTPESVVHLPNRDATVISCTRADLPGQDFPEHIEVTLT
jgi:hypothetical protein